MENLLKVSYRNHNAYSIGVDEISVVSEKRYEEMCNDEFIKNLHVIPVLITDEERDKFNFYQNAQNEFDLSF